LLDTLWDVLKHWEGEGKQVLPAQNSGNAQEVCPVCIYMRQEIVGENELNSKTLRSLGLTNGRAMIRWGIFKYYSNLLDLHYSSFQSKKKLPHVIRLSPTNGRFIQSKPLNL